MVGSGGVGKSALTLQVKKTVKNTFIGFKLSVKITEKIHDINLVRPFIIC